VGAWHERVFSAGDDKRGGDCAGDRRDSRPHALRRCGGPRAVVELEQVRLFRRFSTSAKLNSNPVRSPV
jgi:hypothetical protein